MANGDFGTQYLFGISIGYQEGASPAIRFVLTVDYAAASNLKVRTLDGGTLFLAPSADSPTRDALVTISLADAAGRQWRVLTLGGVKLTQARLDDGRSWALIVVDTADASPANYRATTVDGGNITTVFTGTGDYRALLTDSAADVSATPLVRNVFGGRVAFNAVTGGSALLSGGGAGGPVNSVAPAISTSAVIGTQITGDDGTWTNPGAFTYQWQRNTGSWGDIGGATSKNYTPVDADFGYALRLVVTSGGVSANSNATNLTQEAPVQTLSAELVANNDFSTYSGGFTNWTLSPGTYGGDPGVSQVDPSGGVGTGAAKFFSTGSLALLAVNTSPLATVGAYYESLVEMSARASGSVTWRESSGVFQRILAAVGAGRDLIRNTYAGNPMNLRNSGATDATIDRVSVKQVTLNGELVAPTADMRITQFYTLPSSPIIGDEIRLVVRSSNFSSGNYWVVVLTYSGTQWNINLYSVASHTRTSRIAAAGIGSSNGIRITADGDDWTLETTANGGSNWTSRGTVNNSTYNTATGVNVLATSPFTLSNMQYEAA